VHFVTRASSVCVTECSNQLAPSGSEKHVSIVNRVYGTFLADIDTCSNKLDNIPCHPSVAKLQFQVPDSHLGPYRDLLCIPLSSLHSTTFFDTYIYSSIEAVATRPIHSRLSLSCTGTVPCYCWPQDCQQRSRASSGPHLVVSLHTAPS
jgi:hypothetical protein